MLPGALESKINNQPISNLPTACHSHSHSHNHSHTSNASHTDHCLPLSFCSHWRINPTITLQQMPCGPCSISQWNVQPTHTSTSLHTLLTPHQRPVFLWELYKYCYCSRGDFSSHTLKMLPVFSAGFNSSLASGILKYEKEAPSHFNPLTHIADIVPVPQPILSTGSAVTQPSTLSTTVSVPSPQIGT